MSSHMDHPTAMGPHFQEVAVRQTLRRYAYGDIPLGRVFFHDMLLIGTIINIITGGLALVAYAAGLPGWLALTVFLAPLPYNAALCLFVWRSAARTPSGWSERRIGSLASGGADHLIAIPVATGHQWPGKRRSARRKR